MTTYTLIVPLKPPTKNDIKPDMGIWTFGGRQVPAAFIRVKRLEEKWARWLEPAGAIRRAAGPRRVRFTRVMGPRERKYDPYNLVAGLNAIVMDELRRKGWITDDTETACDVGIPLQRRASETEIAPCTIITIEDLSPEVFPRQMLPYPPRRPPSASGV